MEKSIFFYGSYPGTFVFVFNGVSFDFPLAYFLVMIIVLLVNLSWVVISSAKATKEELQRNTRIEMEDEHFGLLPIVFGGWDHKIR